MTKTILNKDEEEILQDYEKWEFEQINDYKSEKRLLMNAAKNTIKKSVPISIRLPAADIQKLKEKSIKNWVPYQTLISSLVHKYANWDLVLQM